MTTSTLKASLYRIIEDPARDSLAGRVFDTFMITLIVTNVIAVVLESVETIEKVYGPGLYVFDVLSVAVFTVEYALRLWVCTENPMAPRRAPAMARLRYALSPLALIDLLAILPFYLAALVAIDLRFLRVFRILRLLKLTRYSAAIETLARVVYQQRRPLMATIVIAATVLIFASSLMYLLEHTTQPQHFGNIPAAMWWTIVTMTTVGYGDVVPMTPLGRVLAGFVMLTGIGMLALPTGILATGFIQEIRRYDFIVSWRLVSHVPLFSGLDATRIADIVAILKPKQVPPRYAIVRQGENADAMYFLVSGEVEVEMPPHVKRLHAGDYFGEIALLKHCPRMATVLSVTECRLLVLDAADFDRLLRVNPELAKPLHATMATRLRELEQTRGVA
jgi:voltage-gated potassium channel